MTILSAFATVLALVFIMLNAVSKFSKHVQIVAGDTFKNIIQSLTSNPFRGTVVGTIFTAIIQSSAATMVMVVSLVDSGVMSFYNSLGVMFGANIGSASTSFIASLFMNHNAKKAATAHVLYNVVGVVGVLPFFGLFYSLIEMIGGNASQQVANAHVMFNILSAVFFLIFIKPFSLVVEWVSHKAYATMPMSEQKINF